MKPFLDIPFMIQSHAKSVNKILEALYRIYQLTSAANPSIIFDFVNTFSMALYHKWDVKNGFTFVLQLFSLLSDGLGGVWG